jgi:energy-coupling factor transport system substrate-specific component
MLTSQPHNLPISEPRNRSLHLALIPLGIGLNMSLGTIVSMLKLPIYLDMIGTIVVTILSGLWAGVLTAALTQLIVSATINPIYYNFIPTAVAIAMFTHLAARKGAFQTMRGTILAGIGLGLVSGIVSAPIIVYVFGGVVATGRSVMTAYLLSAGERVLNAVLLTGAAAEPVDKTLQCILSVWCINSVPQSLLDRFKIGGGQAVQQAIWTPAQDISHKTSQSIHPVARGLATVIGIIGVYLADNVVVLVFVWLAIILPLCMTAGISRKHMRITGMVVLPLCLLLVALWGWIVGAPPDQMPGSNPEGGVQYALLISLRLAVVGGIFQLGFLSIPQAELLSTFWHWGIRRDNLIVAIGAFTIFPELKIRAEQITTARYARGLLPDRRLITRFRQLPYLLRPLLVWSLRAAIQRSELWDQKRLLDRVGHMRHAYEGSRLRDGAFIGISLIWLVINLVDI